MNHRLCEPFQWRGAPDRPRQGDDGRRPRRRQTFGRYLDVDGDGIPFRTYPGTHPTKGSYFTRGTTDEYARYPRRRRLCAQHGTAAEEVPDRGQDCAAAAAHLRAKPTRYGVIHFGSTSPAMAEALDHLEADGHHVMRSGCGLPLLNRGRGVHPRARQGVHRRAERDGQLRPC